MKPSQITQIIIRLFAIWWFLQGIVQAVGLVTLGGVPISHPLLYGPAVVAFALSIGAWFLAAGIGRAVCKGNDEAGVVSGVTFPQLLQAMIIGIGLYVCATSIGGLLNGLHFFLVMKAPPEGIPSGMVVSVYDFTQSAVSFLAGVFLVGSARRWSHRIAGQ